MREGALVAVGADEHVVPASEAKQLKVRIRELERLLGKKTMEAEILREMSKADSCSKLSWALLRKYLYGERRKLWSNLGRDPCLSVATMQSPPQSAL
jgi:hypothetical protein